MDGVKKSLSVTAGSKQIDTKENILDLILSPNTDLDNNEIYDTRTGETIRRFDE